MGNVNDLYRPHPSNPKSVGSQISHLQFKKGIKEWPVVKLILIALLAPRTGLLNFIFVIWLYFSLEQKRKNGSFLIVKYQKLFLVLTLVWTIEDVTVHIVVCSIINIFSFNREKQAFYFDTTLCMENGSCVWYLEINSDQKPVLSNKNPSFLNKVLSNLHKRIYFIQVLTILWQKWKSLNQNCLQTAGVQNVSEMS